mgnify:FL=1
MTGAARYVFMYNLLGSGRAARYKDCMVTDTLKITLVQDNYTVGAMRANADNIIKHIKEADARGVDLVVFPEMAVTGYPCEDIVFKDQFCERAMTALYRIARETEDAQCSALVGGLWKEEGDVYNATVMIEKGAITHIRRKRSLPNYGVFDEKRIFTKGDVPAPMRWRGMRLGVLICEETWDPRWAPHLARQGAELIISQNGSPYETGKASLRRDVVSRAVESSGLPVIYVNLVGGQDELVFDGRSYIVDHTNKDVARLDAFNTQVADTTWEKRDGRWYCVDGPYVESQGDLETMYQAMVLGLRDYVQKNGFPGVVLGLSGGIDSGLTAAVAADALGADKVHGVFMPSRYTSKESLEDAKQLTENLGIRFSTIPIAEGMEAMEHMLAEQFADTTPDLTEENIQARLRGVLLMALSNKFGDMVLSTGNKSELSVGYSTLYGDMCGGYSVLCDIYKMSVFKLSRWRNRYEGDLPLLQGPVSAVIPERMITKPPTAELRHDQKDEDSLPPYELLDKLLIELIEKRKAAEDLIAEGYDAETVQKVAMLVFNAEYKRRQSAPGVKVSNMSFGRDRRYPITNHWVLQGD